MSKWKALVSPRLGTTDRPGMCLQYAQSFFGAPVAHRSAWLAWLAQEHRHGPEEPLPDVPVLLWFEHWGAYDDGNGPYMGVPVGEKANWGDVRIHVPGDAIYGAPIAGTDRGQSRVATIAEIERAIGATYVGWSESINRLRVAEPGEEDDMFTDEDRALLVKTAQKAGASYDALFKETPTSRGSSAGVLKMLGNIEGPIKATYDAQFKETETSRGTPGGTLVSLAFVIEQLAEIRAHLGIENGTGK